MSPPRAVVIPFGVPTEGRGLGLGLAALVHTCVHLDGGGVALAQLHARKEGGPADGPPAPVEAFVPPAAWKDIAGRGETPPGVGVVVTGAFEPPLDGHGTLQLLAFDARDGRTRARVDASLDELHAGAALVGAIEQLGERLGGQIGALGALRELAWESLESVLRAERCALHDPARGGPHDRLAAMLHLGRAIGDAPAASYPVERLAGLALETAMGGAVDGKLAEAAARALERAADDAPARVELVEALAALQLRLGHPAAAERRLNAALAAEPGRARLYALLAQTLRSQGRIDSALEALASGEGAAGPDALLATERGVALAARGDLAGAAAAWRQALARDPVQPAAFASLAALALRARDAGIAQSLVDAALAADRAHPDVLRRAVQLALASEGEGIARASRVARLCERLLELMPEEPWASLALAKSLVVLGEGAAARGRLARIEASAPGSAPAAEAVAARLALDHPEAEQEVQSVLRAAHAAPVDALGDVAARARRVATLHGSWPAWVAAAVAERRRGRWAAARGALEVALEIAPGATIAHVELAEALLALDDAAGALEHAERVVSTEGESPRALLVLGRALFAAGRTAEARALADRLAAMQPADVDVRALVELAHAKPGRATWATRISGALAGALRRARR